MINGEKITLRAVERADVPRLWEWAQDEETMRLRNYLAPPKSLAEAEREFDAQSAESDLRLAITTQDGELIGETSLTGINPRTGGAKFAIAIGNKDYWGKGYGTDATRTLMRYAFEQLNLHRITLYVHDFNGRAIRAYEKCGFKKEGRLREAEYMDGEYSDVLIMGLLRDELIGSPRTAPDAVRQPAHA
ncbi:MAG: GNAT family N-acetyltransferase [Armatimonadota bacterium]